MGVVYVGVECSVNLCGLFELIDMEVEIDQVGEVLLLLYLYVCMQVEGYLWLLCFECCGCGYVEYVVFLWDDLYVVGVQIFLYRFVCVGDGLFCGFLVCEVWLIC